MGIGRTRSCRGRCSSGWGSWASSGTVLGAIGLIVPEATGIAPILTPIAALGLVAIQVGAIITHVRRKEAQVLPVNIVLLLMALFVAIGRFTIG